MIMTVSAPHTPYVTPKLNKYEEIMDNAKNVTVSAYFEVVNLRSELKTMFRSASAEWQDSNAGQNLQNAMYGLDDVIEKLDNAFDSEPDLSKI